MNPARVIAIDGDPASGKSGIADRLAKRLGTDAIHSGTYFRAAAYVSERRGTSIYDEHGVVRAVKDIPAYLLGRVEDLEGSDPDFRKKKLEIETLSTEGIARAASVISQSKKVRDAVIKRVHEDIDGFALVVVEGQGAGHVFPNQLSFFLTADLEKRILWRHLQTGQPIDDVRRLLTERQESDKARVNAPLRKHPNSIEFRTDAYSSAEEAFEALYQLYLQCSLL